ncbi:MAG TPA: hypothetical protein VGH71_01575 [Gammaproteobacteria bacterium]
MQRNYTLLAALTICIVMLLSYGTFRLFQIWSLPLGVDIQDGRTATLQPLGGMPMPEGFRPGDQIELSAQPQATRIAILIDILSVNLGQSLPAEGAYDFVVRRDTGPVVVTAHAIDVSSLSNFRPALCLAVSIGLLTGVMALLTLWRGRDRAAVGLAIFTTSLTLSGAILMPRDGATGVLIFTLDNLLFLVGRVGLYLMADAIAKSILSRRARTGWLTVFVVVALAGAGLNSIGGPVLYAFTGWSSGIAPSLGMLWSMSYLVPTLMLFACYRRAGQEQRLRLRWLMWSSVVYTAGVFTSNWPVVNPLFSLTFTDGTQFLGVAGMLYAVLRHQVLDVSVVIDKTLVYGATTSLVVGVIAAMNSLALRATLGEGAGLLLQLVVPLALGIVLGKVRGYMDLAVERVFFRTKYLADKALRNFGKQCAYITDMGKLLDASVTELRKHSRSPAVALYEAGSGCYACLRSAGEASFARVIDLDDPALVAVRAEMKPVELSELDSALGKDGCVFPIEVLGHLRGVMVCANRPGEHFSKDEKGLLAEVVRDVGAAWRILKSRENEEFVLAVAQGNIKATAVRKRAKLLATGWNGAQVRA